MGPGETSDNEPNGQNMKREQDFHEFPSLFLLVSGVFHLFQPLRCFLAIVWITDLLDLERHLTPNKINGK